MMAVMSYAKLFINSQFIADRFSPVHLSLFYLVAASAVAAATATAVVASAATITAA